nr:MMPL family transporter [Micromonospora sp. DSM 115978]
MSDRLPHALVPAFPQTVPVVPAVVPVVAVIGFGLTIAASFGVEVAVFQWGWLSDVLGVTPSPTVCFLPIIILAVLFGLSNDYEVFVVSHIREDYVTTGEAVPAVRRGLAKSTKVVAPAAVVMFSVFASFLVHPDPIVQPIALTLAFGVLADAFVVRLSLVPATLAMLGKHSWALGPFLRRVVPDLDVEGANLPKKLAAT